jgi:cytidylate kinase
MVRIITIAREYGSGGETLAAILGKRLQWRLIDDSLVSQVAARARMTPAEVSSYEETVDPWTHRLSKALWRGGFTGTATRSETEACDGESVARLWHAVILEAAELGQCVVVGRGAQCLLQRRQDAFHVFVYAPLSERIARLRPRLPRGTDLAAAARERDHRRTEYIRHYFGQEWRNPHLYHLMVCSSIGLESAAEAVLCATGLAGGVQ